MINTLQKNKYFKFWLIGFLGVLSFSLISLITILCIALFVTKNFSILFGFLLCLFIPYFFIFVNWLVKKIFVDTKHAKILTIIFVTLLQTIKYCTFFVLPLVGYLINNQYSQNIFDIWGVLISLIIAILFVVYCRIINWYIAHQESKSQKK